MEVDTMFNVYNDARGGDPDITSPTLRKYHKILWSKPLPNGMAFDLSDNKSGVYLYHKSQLGEYFLGSDAITHSYRNHKRKQWLTRQIPDEVSELFNTGATIGAFTIFPNNRVNGKHTINGARGCNSWIDDRFDLTLQCIKLFYQGQQSPLYGTLLRYRSFFELFESFIGYIKFFLLDDVVDEKGEIKFYLPFDDFKTKPAFSHTDDYLFYKSRVKEFVISRNKRIESDISKRVADRNAS